MVEEERCEAAWVVVTADYYGSKSNESGWMVNVSQSYMPYSLGRYTYTKYRYR